ncbi:MAG: 50S ribosomal protein L4 [Candidatus Kerfeldbacteria bacterium]|nr:50S ribosomal protein L4 [Candidatus Kerfeldbacteria bacterium]
MPSVKLYNLEGAAAGTTELPDRIFGVKVKSDVVEQAVLAQRNNARVAIAHTKTRGEVRGGGKKPWRQKGTGRARHGSIRSPIWKGGGVTFGPRNTRNFSVKINKKQKQQALFMALSDKVANERLILVDQLTLAQPKTKLFAQIMKKLPIKGSTLVVLPGANMALIKSSRNIPGVTPIRGDSLNVLDVVKHVSILMPAESVDVITKTFTSGARKGQA